ncbi:hypothetical protein GKODMF_03585 [Candidatus Electrothrix gigas]
MQCQMMTLPYRWMTKKAGNADDDEIIAFASDDKASDNTDKESALSDSGKDTDILSLDDEFSEEEDELDSFFDFDDDDEIATVSDAVPDDDLALSLDDKEAGNADDDEIIAFASDDKDC